MTYAVRFEEVSKKYPRGGPRYVSLRTDLSSAVRRIARNPFGREPGLRGPLALDKASFTLEAGESMTIVGPNGSGKSTALKLISRISYPTGGTVRVRGRVGALIEVASGVHPELSGRENIRLYGQIHGLSSAEVRRRFDEIVEFAELGHVLDRPVKMYSSGMQLRLGFSIAAHLDPDVMIIDEALAVGDAGFQAKCVERMTSLVGEGTSLLLVSHDLAVVEGVCQRGIFLLDGRVEADGDIKDVLRQYVAWVDQREMARKGTGGLLSGGGLTIEEITVHGDDGIERYEFDPGERIEARFHVQADRTIRRPRFSVGIGEGRRTPLIYCSMVERSESFDISAGRHIVSCQLGPLPLRPRPYELWAGVTEEHGVGLIIEWSRVGMLRIRLLEEVQGPTGLTSPWMFGPVEVDHAWRLTDGEDRPPR